MEMSVAIANKIFYSLFSLKIVTGVDDLDFMRQDVSLTLFTTESSFHALSTRFEPLYTNMYLIGPSDGAVSRYTLIFKIDRATSVILKILCIV